MKGHEFEPQHWILPTYMDYYKTASVKTNDDLLQIIRQDATDGYLLKF